MSRRDDLHRMVDELPEQVLERAQQALVYCAYPDKLLLTVEQAKRRVLERSRQRLREFGERTGKGYIGGMGSGGGMTRVDGTHHSSMVAFENGKDATYHLYVYRGVTFEIVETLEESPDGQQIIRRERITGPDGTEQTLTAQMRKSGDTQDRSTGS
jgi:hypothetical protein